MAMSPLQNLRYKVDFLFQSFLVLTEHKTFFTCVRQIFYLFVFRKQFLLDFFPGILMVLEECLKFRTEHFLDLKRIL